MHLKTILYPMSVEQNESDLQPIVSLAESADVHLVVALIAVAPPMPPVSLEAAVPSQGWALQLAEQEQALHSRADALNEQLRSRGQAAEVRPVFCDPGQVDDTLGVHARYADLVLITRGWHEDPWVEQRVTYGALFLSGTPVLLANAGSPDSFNFKTVMVAWDGNVQAARAVSEAVPWLQQADKVQIVCVDPDSTGMAATDEPGWDLAAWLARHDVQVDVNVVPGNGRNVNEVLARTANERGADLIVMGAYGHSRLRQRLFGGTTRSLLQDAAQPLLLVH